MSSEKIHSLVNKAKKGDKEAFGDLYEIHSREMFTFARWYLGDVFLAEDAVSDAVLNAYISIKNVREPEKFKSWLFTILLRCCRKNLKNIINLRQSVDITDIQKESAEASPEEKAELKAALEKISEEDREILLLSSLGNLTSVEIGEMLSMAPGTVRSKLSRSTDKLCDLLSERSFINGK